MIHLSFFVRSAAPVLTAAVVLAGPQRAVAQPSERLAAVLDSVRVEFEAPGALLGVLRGDGPPQVVAVGQADREMDRAMAPDDPFYLGSVTKTWTAVAILRLYEEGRLELEDPLSRWIPDFPRGDEITVRQLLAHTSGLKDFYSYFYYRPDRDEMIDLVTRDWTQPELIEWAGRFGHWFEPGEDWTYSNSGYFLLGVIAERASGQSLEEVYRTRIEEPLGLERMWIQGHETPEGTVPTGYMGPVEGWTHSEMFGELGPTTELDRGVAEWGAGGLVAPADEALAFLDAVVEGRLLDPESVALMTTFRDTPPLGVPDPDDDGTGPSDGYGFGLVRMRVGGFTLVGHGGLYNGHTTGLWRVQGCDLTIVTYVNRGFVGQRPLLRAAIDVLLPDGSCSGG